MITSEIVPVTEHLCVYVYTWDTPLLTKLKSNVVPGLLLSVIKMASPRAEKIIFPQNKAAG